MRKIPIIIFLITLGGVASCAEESNNDSVVEKVSFDSPALLRVDENTSINEKGIGDD